MATAFIQHLSSLIRIGADGAKFGDAWGDAEAGDPLSVIWITNTEVHLLGLRSKFSEAKFRAIEKLLSQLGVDKATWDRKRKNGSMKRLDWNIRHDLYRDKP